VSRFIRTVVVLGCLCATPAFAQPPAAPPAPAAPAAQEPSTRKQIIEEIVLGGVRAHQKGVNEPFQTQLGTGLIVAYFIAAHSDRQGYKELLLALEARASKQVGSVPTSKGTTSLAMKGLAPAILGFAVETGAVAREVSGTTLTFRATPAGVIKALQSKGLLDMYTDYTRSPLQRQLARISVAASFDASKGPSAGSFAADERQLTNWSIRGEVFNQRDPASPQYADLWGGLLRTSPAYLAASAAITTQLGTWTEYDAWETQLLAETARVVEAPLKLDRNVNAAAARFRALLESALPKMEKLTNMPAPALKALDEYVAQLTKVQAAIDDVYGFAGKGSLVTLDWSTARDLVLPDLYTVTGVWEHALGASRKTALTVNGAVVFYRDKPTGIAHRLKSVDFTGQLDHPIGSVFNFEHVTLTVAGRFSHIPNDTVAAAPKAASGAAVTAASPKGNIGLIQVKFTVPVKNSGVKVPLSISASNRTELIKERDVRASFGITYDLDALIGGLFRRP
jgi:hypothetical protein